VQGRRGEQLEGFGKGERGSSVRRDSFYKIKMPNVASVLKPKQNGSCTRSIEVTKKGWNRNGRGIVNLLETIIGINRWKTRIGINDLVENRNGSKDRGIPNSIEYKWFDRSSHRRDP
jgi:hypothetical protein